MAPSKDAVPKSANALAVSGLSGKAITGLDVFVHGSVTVVQIAFSGGSQFMKVKGLETEVGGTAEWGTGTKIT